MKYKIFSFINKYSIFIIFLLQLNDLAISQTNSYQINTQVVSQPTNFGYWSFNTKLIKLNNFKYPVIIFQDSPTGSTTNTFLSPIRIYTSKNGNDYVESTSTLFPDSPKGYYTLRILTADINHDGITDILIADESESSGITSSNVVSSNGSTPPPWPGAPQKVLLSQPNGTYKTTFLPGPTISAHAASIDQLDKSGNFSVLMTNIADSANDLSRPTSILWDSDNKGNFSISNRLPAGINNKMYFFSGMADLNNDGFVDLIFFSPTNPSDTAIGKIPTNLSTIYWNDGNGGFSDNNVSHIPVEKVLSNNGKQYYMAAQGVKFADFNLDGLLDIFIDYMNLCSIDGNCNNTGAYQSYGILINHGNGNFTDETASWFSNDLYHASDISALYGNNDSRIFLNDFNNSGLPSFFYENHWSDSASNFNNRRLVYLNTGNSFSPIDLVELDNPSITTPNATSLTIRTTCSTVTADTNSPNLSIYNWDTCKGSPTYLDILNTQISNLPNYSSNFDTYNSQNNQLTIKNVSVGKAIYKNVVIEVDKVVNIGSPLSTPLPNFDTYDTTTGIVYLPTVIVGSNVYHNISITISKVISVGN